MYLIFFGDLFYSKVMYVCTSMFVCMYVCMACVFYISYCSYVCIFTAVILIYIYICMYAYRMCVRIFSIFYCGYGYAGDGALGLFESWNSVIFIKTFPEAIKDWTQM